MNENIVEKYIKPGILNKAPHGQIWYVAPDKSYERPDYYIQVSKNEENPRWLTMGSFLENVFKAKILNADGLFVQKCLQDFTYYE